MARGWGRGYGTSWGSFGPLGGPVTVVESLAFSEGLVASLPLKVDGAFALSENVVLVEFSHDLDLGYTPNFQIASYSIPGLTVTYVNQGPTDREVVLETSDQSATTYTLTVLDAQTVPGDSIDPLYDTALFSGYLSAPTFFATAQSTTKIEIVFSEEVANTGDLINPLRYTLLDLVGNALAITSVVTSGPSPLQRVTITPTVPLVAGEYYSVELDATIKTDSGLNFVPAISKFQWIPGTGELTIPISAFSGEVSGGLLGTPLGQVFFSPSLAIAVPDTSIQVDEVNVCTRAYDVYSPPEIPDPAPFMTWRPETPNLTNSILGGPDVIFASFNAPNRMMEAQINLTDTQSETMPAAVDGPADATLTEVWDLAYVSLLNVPQWEISGGAGTPFMTADNAAPIPPGTVTNINLQP